MENAPGCKPGAYRYFCWRKIDISAWADSIYLLTQIRYDINPLSPRRAYRVDTHIERFAYIENPVRDLYRAYLHSSASLTAARVMPMVMKKANMTLG